MNVLNLLKLDGRRHLPTVIVAEQAECGLGCLAMIAAYHGHNVEINGLRQRYSISNAGVGLRNILDYAADLGFSTRALKVDLEQIRNIRLPAIIHWNLNHFVVLAKANRRSVLIHDPARGQVRMTYEEF